MEQIKIKDEPFILGQNIKPLIIPFQTITLESVSRKDNLVVLNCLGEKPKLA